MPARRQNQSEPIIAWVDGKILPASSPALPVFDQAYLSGMGAFETLRAEGGRPWFLEAHYHRLAASAACFDLEIPDIEIVRKAIHKLLARQNFSEARIRITISGAIKPDGMPFRFGGKCHATLIAFPLEKSAANPLRIVTAPFRMNSMSPLAGHKCTSYAEHALAMHHARTSGCDDALILDHLGHVVGCATGNIFWVKAGEVFTPSTRCGCRDGVTRERVIFTCKRLRIPCTTTRKKVVALADADEVFTTSSIRGVRSVIAIDGKKLPSGRIGKLLRAAFIRETRARIQRD